MSFLQIFLIVNAFILGVVITLAIQYLMEHRRGKKKPTAAPVAPTPITPEVRERISKQAEANFQGIVNRSGLQLQSELGTTSTQLNKLLEKFGGEVLDDEMKLFRANVADLRSATQGSLSGAQDQITAQQIEILKSLSTRQAELDARMRQKQLDLETQLEQSFAVQKQALTKQLNDKLNDAVLSFLLETLGHDVDLGAQADYLIATLEANKADLVGTALGPTAPATAPTVAPAPPVAQAAPAPSTATQIKVAGPKT